MPRAPRRRSADHKSSMYGRWVCHHDPVAPLVAFLHGGSHHAGCWDDTVAVMHRVRPELRVVTVDMPGRRDQPGELATLTIEQSIAACRDQIEHVRNDYEQVVIVGHSLAGVLMPGLARKLGIGTLRRAIFVACCVPPPGQCVVDTLPTGLHWFVRRIVARSPVLEAVPWFVLRFFSATAPPVRNGIGFAPSHAQRAQHCSSRFHKRHGRKPLPAPGSCQRAIVPSPYPHSGGAWPRSAESLMFERSTPGTK